MSARERLVSLADRVQRIQLWVAATALVILMMVTVIDVFMRYLFNRPIRASLDTVEVMLLVFVFNGMAAAFFGRRHIVIDLLDGVFGPRITARADPHRRYPVGALSRRCWPGPCCCRRCRPISTAT